MDLVKVHMKLRDAINAVIPFAGPVEEARQYIRIKPYIRDGDEMGYVEAASIGYGARAYYTCENDIIDGLIAAADLTAALSVIKKTETITASIRGPGTLALEGEKGGFAYVSLFADSNQYQPTETPDRLTVFTQHDDITTALHACPKLTKATEHIPAITCLHFTPHGIESTDENRICRILRPGLANKPNLVPRSGLINWPKKSLKIPPSIGWTETHAWLYAAGVLRWIRLEKGPYIDFTEHLPPALQGFSSTLARMAFKGAIRDAYVSSPQNIVELRFAGNQIAIAAIDAERNDTTTYQNVIDAPTSNPDLITIIVNGKFLYEALNAHHQEEIELVYSPQARDPLRVKDFRAESTLFTLQKAVLP